MRLRRFRSLRADHRQVVPRVLRALRGQDCQRDGGSFNRIDEASRADLPLLNEQNASRFEARLSQQTAELGARIDGVDERIDGLGKQIEALDGTLSAFRDELNKALLSQTRWMIGAWGVLLASQVGLWLR